jgi:hypothetical protein
MIRSLKAAFGLSLMAALVFSSISVMSASGTVSGQFVSSTTNTKYTVTEKTGTTDVVTLHAYGGKVTCHKPQYSVHHTNTTTFQTITVTPINDTDWNCTHTNGEHATVHFKGCHYRFSSRTPPAHATVHFVCPTGVKAEVTIPSTSSTLSFGAQTPTTKGVTYTNLADGTITANITAEGIHVTCHGACQLFGTTKLDATMVGAAIVSGFETTTGAKSHLTAK